MKEKTGSETTWIIFSVVLVVAPVILVFIVSSIENERLSTPSEILDAVILIVFSISCSLLSISWQVKNQKNKKEKNKNKKEDRYINMIFYFSLLVWFISWNGYLLSLTEKITDFAKIMLIISFVIIIVLSYFGIKISQKSDANENEAIYTMHNNCNEIRAKLVSKEDNNSLNILMLHKNDLLCNPDNFDRVDYTIKNVIKK